MRVFVTGATGFIGSAIVRELLTAGHQVLGLARSAEAAEVLEKLGAESHRGELSDTESLSAGARASDGVIHAAFIHDFSAYVAAAETDKRAIETLADALEGSGKPFVATSVTTLLTPEHIGSEEDAPMLGSSLGPRAASENAALSAANRGVRSSVVRLPPSVHGAGDHAFVPALIDLAQRNGFAAFVGDGSNRWPAVHRLDAARLFLLGLEKAKPGTRLHAAAEEGIPMREIATTIGEQLGVPVCRLVGDEASEYFGWLTGFVAVDNPTSSTLTRTRVGWHPEQDDLLSDMQKSGYFSR